MPGWLSIENDYHIRIPCKKNKFMEEKKSYLFRKKCYMVFAIRTS